MTPRQGIKPGMIWLAVITTFTLVVATARADELRLRERTRQQEITADMGRQLVADVLRVQLSQLAENGLDDLALFSDIQQMRVNVESLSEDEMRGIVGLLKRAEEASEGEQQQDLVRDARREARYVATVLMAERARLRERLKNARLQAELRRLRRRQEQVKQHTEELQAFPEEKRDRETLETLDDQQDTRVLFDQLRKSLESAGRADLQEIPPSGEGDSNRAASDMPEPSPQADSQPDSQARSSATSAKTPATDSVAGASDRSSRDSEITPTREFPNKSVDAAPKEGQNDARGAANQANATSPSERQPPSSRDASRSSSQAPPEGQKNHENLAGEIAEDLQRAGVAEAFGEVEKSLRVGATEQAAAKQQEIVDRLIEAEKKMARADGSRSQSAGADELLEKLQNLDARQRQLQQQTAEVADEDQAAWDELSREQRELHEDLQRLGEEQPLRRAEKEQVDEASGAAWKAEANLFEGRRQAAMEQQQQVVDNLEELADAVSQRRPEDELEEREAGKEASLAAELQQLEQLSDELEKLQREQGEVIAEAAQNPAAAEPSQQRVASGLGEQARRQPLTPPLQKSLDSATRTAREAAEALKNRTAAAAQQRSAMGQVKEAIAEAQQLAATRSQTARAALREARAETLARFADQLQPGRLESAQAGTAQSGPQREGQTNRQQLDPVAESRETASQANAPRRSLANASGSAGDDRPLGRRAARTEPWFARLPEQLREAIRMRGRPQPPRGYEERLKRYFESVDK